MRRRDFLGVLGGVAAWPVGARGQQGKVWRVGYFTSGTLGTPATMSWLEALRQEMRKLGYVEGKNLVIVTSAAEGHIDRLPDLANELVSLACDAIVALATPAIAASQRATSTIPIIMCPATDPIGSGFIKNFARPGGNITGLANMFGDLTAKSLEILHAVLPDAKTIAVLMSPNPTHPPIYDTARAAADSLGLTTVPIVASTPADLGRAFQEIVKAKCDALFVLADPIRPTIVSLAADFKVPAIYQISEFVEAGGLASYGPIMTAMFKRAAHYVDKIFKGEQPAELPVEQPTTFELVLNLKTARALRLTMSQSLLLRADKVIE